MMHWLPTEDWSGRLLTVGALTVAIAVVIALGGEVATPHAFFRTFALVLAVTGGAVGMAGVVISGLGKESVRRTRRAQVGSFYGKHIVYVWRSLPLVGKVAFGVVVPVAAATIAVLIWTGAPRQVVVLMWLLSLVVFGMLLAFAGRTQIR